MIWLLVASSNKTQIAFDRVQLADVLSVKFNMNIIKRQDYVSAKQSKILKKKWNHWIVCFFQQLPANALNVQLIMGEGGMVLVFME